MRGFSGLLFCIALLGSTPAALANATVPVTLSFNFDQTYAFVACPTGTPAGYACLNVTGHQSSTFIGDVSFQRIVFVNENGYNPNDPLCLPDETSGTLTAGSSQMTFRAAGNVCFVDGTAAYNVVITGGTGRFAGVIGGGRITVPPPATASTGQELWEIQIYLK